MREGGRERGREGERECEGEGEGGREKEGKGMDISTLSHIHSCSLPLSWPHSLQG